MQRNVSYNFLQSALGDKQILKCNCGVVKWNNDAVTREEATAVFTNIFETELQNL